LPQDPKKPSIIQYILTFAILMTFWYLLSGYLEPFYIGAGIVSSLVVTAVSADLMFRSQKNVLDSARIFVRFLFYIPWLMVEILYANIDVAYRILHPKMPIDPGMITIETPFKGDILRTSFANALTLTPGTVTIDVRRGTFVVHALVMDVSNRELLEKRGIEKSLGRIFGEEQ